MLRNAAGRGSSGVGGRAAASVSGVDSAGGWTAIQRPFASSRIFTFAAGGSPASWRPDGSCLGMDSSLGRSLEIAHVLGPVQAAEGVGELGVDLGVEAHAEVRGADLDQLGVRIEAGAPVHDPVAA